MSRKTTIRTLPPTVNSILAKEIRCDMILPRTIKGNLRSIKNGVMEYYSLKEPAKKYLTFHLALDRYRNYLKQKKEKQSGGQKTNKK